MRQKRLQVNSSSATLMMEISAVWDCCRKFNLFFLTVISESSARLVIQAGVKRSSNKLI